MAEDEIVLLAKAGQARKQVGRRDRAGRVVRVAADQQPCTVGGSSRNRLEIGLEPVGSQQRQRERLGGGEERSAGVDRIAGIGDDRQRARVEDGQSEVCKTLLGAEQRQNLRLGVERDAKAPCIVLSDGLP